MPVGRATRLRTGRPRDHGSLTGRRKKCLFSTASRSALGPMPPIQWVQGVVSPVLQRPASETDHSPPSSADIKNGGAIYTSTPSVFLTWSLIKQRDFKSNIQYGPPKSW
jgi:hypothetical protein